MPERDVLVVDDDAQIRTVLHQIFSTAGYSCMLASHGGEGVEMFRQARPSIVVTDLKLPVVDGRDLVHQVCQEDPEAAVIILTRPNDVKAAIACLKLGAYAFLMKPINGAELLITVRRALERRELLIERRQHQQPDAWSQDIRPRDVLIVEEDSHVRDVFQRILDSAATGACWRAMGKQGSKCSVSHGRRWSSRTSACR